MDTKQRAIEAIEALIKEERIKIFQDVSSQLKDLENDLYVATKIETIMMTDELARMYKGELNRVLANGVIGRARERLMEYIK